MKFKLLLLPVFCLSLIAGPLPVLQDFGTNTVVKGGKFQGDGSLLYYLPNTINVMDYGAKGNGTDSDTAAFNTAYAVWLAKGGNFVVPFGRFPIHMTVTNSGFIMNGSGSSMDAANFTRNGVGTILMADSTNAVVTFKYPTPGEYVRNSGLRNLGISGSVTTTNNFSPLAVNFAGGTVNGFMDNVQISWFKYGIWMQGDTNMECDLALFNRIDIRMGASGVDSRGVYIAAPDGTNTTMTYTTAPHFTGLSHFYAHPNGGMLMEVDSTEAYLNNVYMDDSYSTLTNTHSVLLTKTKFSHFAQDPAIHNGLIDGGGIKVWVEGGTTNIAQNSFMYHAPGTLIAGYMRYNTGDIQRYNNGTQGPGGQYSEMPLPIFVGAAYIRPVGFYGDPPLSNSISVGSDNSFTINSGNNLAIRTTGDASTLNLISPLPRINFIAANPPFATSFISSTNTGMTISPVSGTPVVILGTGLNADINGKVTAPTLLVNGSATFGGNLLGVSSNMFVIVTNQFQVFAPKGLFTASTSASDGPALYFFHNITNATATNALVTFQMQNETNMYLGTAVSGGGRFIVDGDFSFNGLHQFSPAVMTKAQKDALNPSPGSIVYQTDNTEAFRFYQGTNWTRYLTTIPGTLGHYYRGDGTNYVDSVLNASDLATGTVPTARLGSGVANNATILYGDGTWKPLSGGTYGDVYQIGTNVFSGTNSFSGITLATNYSNLINGTFAGVGSGLSALNGSAISSGIVNANYLGTGSPDFTQLLTGNNTWQPINGSMYRGVNGTIVNNVITSSTIGFNNTTNLITNFDSLETYLTGNYASTSGSGNILFSFGYGGTTNAFTIPATAGMSSDYIVQWNIMRIDATHEYASINFTSSAFSRATNYVMNEDVTTASAYFVRAVTPVTDNVIKFYTYKMRYAR